MEFKLINFEKKLFFFAKHLYNHRDALQSFRKGYVTHLVLAEWFTIMVCENDYIYIYIYIFFSIRIFFHEHSRPTGLKGKGEGISLTPQYHFHPFHRHLDISRTISAESSPLHITISRTRTGNLWFPSASR